MALKDEMCSAIEGYFMNAPSDWNTVTADRLKQELAVHGRILVLDVREPDEFASGHIAGAVNVPVRQLPARVKELPQDKSLKIVAYCASGVRSAYATMFLRVYGFGDVRTLDRGIRGWVGEGYEIVR
jgi:rhodanese-related sulfurtransferase